MSEKTEQSQGHSDLPEMKEFNAMSLEEQESTMAEHYENQGKEEQDTEDSENTDEVLDEEKPDKKDDQDSKDEDTSEDEDKDDSESDSTKDNQDGDEEDKDDKDDGGSQQLQTQIDELKSLLHEEIKGRKALQADYTKKATELKELKSQEATEESAQASSAFDKELKELEAKDPEVGALFRRMHEGALHAAREKAQQEIDALKESLTKDTNEKNLQSFHDQVGSAMEGKYKDLQTQFDEVTLELYPDDEGLRQAASADPNKLFNEIETAVRSRFPREVIASEDKEKLTKKDATDKERDKELNKVNGVKKTKTSKKAKKDKTDLVEFNKLSLEEQEVELKKQGKWSAY